MVMIALSSSLIGAVLGTRFRVHVLFPVMLFGFLLIIAVAALKASPLAMTVAGLVLFAVGLQLGYFVGLLTRFCLVAARSPSRHSLRSSIIRN